MLFTQAQKRMAREAADALERITLAVNNGLAISRSERAMRAFENARARRTAPPTEAGQTVAEYRSTMARLAARFPGNVTVH